MFDVIRKDSLYTKWFTREVLMVCDCLKHIFHFDVESLIINPKLGLKQYPRGKWAKVGITSEQFFKYQNFKKIWTRHMKIHNVFKSEITVRGELFIFDYLSIMQKQTLKKLNSVFPYNVAQNHELGK